MYPLVNRTPFLAIESTLGVGISGLPWNPYSPYPTSSDRMMMTFGLAADAGPAATRAAARESRTRRMEVLLGGAGRSGGPRRLCPPYAERSCRVGRVFEAHHPRTQSTRAG